MPCWEQINTLHTLYKPQGPGAALCSQIQCFAFFRHIKHISVISAGTEDPEARRQTLGLASQLLIL